MYCGTSLPAWILATRNKLVSPTQEQEVEPIRVQSLEACLVGCVDRRQRDRISHLFAVRMIPSHAIGEDARVAMLIDHARDNHLPGKLHDLSLVNESLDLTLRIVCEGVSSLVGPSHLLHGRLEDQCRFSTMRTFGTLASVTR